MADELATQADPGALPGDLGTLLQAQKAELVGQLARAMANQFNNIMMAITSSVELELKRATPAQKRNLEQILGHTARAAALIQKLLAFSDKHSPSPRRLALNSVVDDICRLLQPLVGEDIAVSVKLDPSVGSILADSVEIEHLVLSLGLNAREALTQGGTITVSTELVDLDPKTFGSEEIEHDGPHAVLSLQYTPASTSTKSEVAQPLGNQDKCMTQAIAAVRGIVKQRRGHFRASTRPGQGTIFRLYFPATAAEPAAAMPQPVGAATAASTKTILIVEDDDAVRNPAAEFLMMEGFKVLQARTGPEALRIVQESRSRLDLLVTDIVMAGMHGNQVAEELHKTHPGLKVLYMSGDAHKAATLSKAAANRAHVLQKPFRFNKLSDKIHELLGD